MVNSVQRPTMFPEDNSESIKGFATSFTSVQ